MVGFKLNRLSKWRDYFKTLNSDIFDIIEYAIIVAASDYPEEFRIKRDEIAETLFSCKLSKNLGFDRVELLLHGGGADDADGDGRCKGGFGGDGCEFKYEDQEERNDEDQGERNENQVSNYSYNAAEALNDEIEQEAQIFGEVMRIKEIIENNQNETDSVLLESLRKLQLMALSMEALEATEIGKAVNRLQKHASKDISILARMLIKEWRAVVDEWANAKPLVEVASEATPESRNPSVLDEEEGLPSPPLDDLPFLSSTMELSQFFDGMEDFGNPRNCRKLNKSRGNERKPPLENSHNVPQMEPQQLQNEPAVTPLKETKVELTKKEEPLMKKQTSFVKSNKPSVTESGPGRPMKPNMEQRAHNLHNIQKETEKITTPRRPLASQQDKLKCSNDASNQTKLEITKRKLQERYQEAENAKRQRTVQVMELRDLPKQGLGHKSSLVKVGSNHHHNRQWANGRR